MSVLDIILLGVIGLGLVRGFMKGFFVEIASVIALIAGVYGAIHFSNYAETFIDENSQWDEKTINIVAFAVTFLIIVLAIALAGKALTKLADFAALGIVNKLLGALFGAIKLALILSVVLNIYDITNRAIPMTDEKSIEDSALYTPVKSLVPMMFPIILEKKKELEEDWEEDPVETDSTV
ncbi:CvpA family protein [Gelidibacter japonicus]|uniref:CvpA family protein n=1 Tax=Gelidibacter japonicus TaxID=1962232 RepID=UPI0020216C1E|nr:CvpA family protein [Gelidibacter japonicus]MCL8008579.1 CvpA family protein [Gelidibacter japonicus]